MSRIKNINKKRLYAYEEYEDREGQRRLKRISDKRYAEGNYENEPIISSKSPKDIKERQELYEEGLIGIGDKTHSDNYLDTIEWGSMGGRPRKWANNAERMRFIRTQQKLQQGKSLLGEELDLVYKHGSLSRPMSSVERKRLSRYRKGTK